MLNLDSSIEMSVRSTLSSSIIFLLTHYDLYDNIVYAQCAAGNHDFETKYGPVGIILAIALFPIGLFCLRYVTRLLRKQLAYKARLQC